jgi:hypothetical protein
LTQLRLFGGWQNRIKLCPLQTVVEIQKMCKEGFDVAFLGPRKANVLKGQDFFLDFTISCRMCCTQIFNPFVSALSNIFARLT